MGAVKRWWKGRSKNWPTNLTFHTIFQLLAPTKSSVLTCYIPSTNNPADSPSRRKYSSSSLLLPPIPIPINLGD